MSLASFYAVPILNSQHVPLFCWRARLMPDLEITGLSTVEFEDG
jgi:hypothetical protein